MTVIASFTPASPLAPGGAHGGFGNSSGSRSEQPIAGIAKPWDDVPVVVQMAVHRAGIRMQVRMRAEKRTQAFRRRDETDEPNVFDVGASFGQKRGARERRGARRQHR